jgi:hypothetical protein
MRVIEKTNVIQFLDERFYESDGEYFPSATTILDVYPKEFGFNQWLKDLGQNANEVLRRAGERGSKVHDAINQLLLGEEVEWEGYDWTEWQMINRFLEFWGRYKPKLVGSEVSLVSKELGYGGTLDLICVIDDEIWLIDHKTGNGIYTSHQLQLASYKHLWYKRPYKTNMIDRYGVLWLNSTTRTEKEFQGKGWQLKEFTEEYEKDLKSFEQIKDIWKRENPNAKPKNLELPVKISLQTLGY